MTYERIGFPSIAKVEVLRDLKDVYVSILGRRPTGNTRRHYFQSPGNRYARLSPSQARKVAYRLIEAASKVERKADKYGFWIKETGS
jgi:hypothetical protein